MVSMHRVSSERDHHMSVEHRYTARVEVRAVDNTIVRSKQVEGLRKVRLSEKVGIRPIKCFRARKLLSQAHGSKMEAAKRLANLSIHLFGNVRHMTVLTSD